MLAVPYGIGVFIREWTIHERKIAWLIAFDSGDHPNAVRDRLVLGRTGGFSEALEQLKKKYASHSNIAALLDDLITAQNKAIKDRHDIVHGFWEGRDEQGHYVKRVERAGPGYVRHFTADKLTSMADGVHALGMTMMKVANAIAVTKNEQLPYPALSDV